jgi:uncharacterized protein DUF6576
LSCGQPLRAVPASARWLSPVGRVFSCPVAVHKSCVLLVFGALLVELGWMERDLGPRLVEFAQALGVWASVVLAHELGHLLSMRLQRLTCRQAVLYPLPLVGVRSWGIRGNARQRAAVALAGPVASLTTALVLLPLIPMWPDRLWPYALCALHALVGAVNLLPMDPFDGAMIFRRTQEAPVRPEPVSREAPASVEELFEESGELELDMASLGPEPAPDVDQILDKILASGMESLTEQERSILQEASRHLRR